MHSCYNLKEQRDAMEYVDEDVRKQNAMKAKVNFVNDIEDFGEDNSIHKQLEEIVKGLAHVTKLVSDPLHTFKNNRH